jgi:excisionase family DNA binding protein
MPVAKSRLPVAPESKLLLSTGEACRVLDVSPNTLRKMIASGEIAAKMIRKRWGIPRIEAERYLADALAGADQHRRVKATEAAMAALQGGAS